MNSQNRVAANHDIRHKSVRLVDEDGSKVLSTYDAIKKAEQAGLDLILINEKADPPICKIYELSKYLYDLKIKAKDAAKSQREGRVSIKEVQFKPNIDNHDFETKCRNIARFVAKGNKVKLLVQFRGRERQHTDIGFDIIERVLTFIDDVELESKPQFAGSRITAILIGNKDDTTT
jgi:translation initiation factor IF-3